MFNLNSTFWSSLIIWDFWHWKTFWVENICYLAKDKRPDDVLLISNIPNSIVDINFNSPEDLKTLIEYLFRFFIETNGDIKHYNKTFRDILFVVDEAHNYFPQDWSVLSADKELLQKLRVILTQCRKRNVKFYLCTQRGKTININVRRYTDFIYLFVLQKYFDSDRLKKNTLEIYKCWGGVADLLGEDGVSWATIDDLEKDKIDVLTMAYNTFIRKYFYRLEHKDWALRKEKELTQYICGLPWDYLDIRSYEEFKEKLVYWGLEEDYKFNQLFNRDWLPLFVNDMFFYANSLEREKKRFI